MGGGRRVVKNLLKIWKTKMRNICKYTKVDSGKGMYLTNDWLYCTIKGIINISCRKREPLSIWSIWSGGRNRWAKLLVTVVVLVKRGRDSKIKDVLNEFMFRFSLPSQRRRENWKESREQVPDLAWVWRISRLKRDETAEPVSRDQILRREQGQGIIHFPCSANHDTMPPF